ncbi:MAG: hormogonium polysaccharide secretion pseudopilin HpsB [Trichormus sp. ATA11-4-KO1]|jgi:prepilin-type N-terminal cleavage/methylation domain-containing protein|nr:hormogonium polysaccharide secretion pseudopilin HpsB [Trichormus sp. ATA11-4-KO1]
MIHHQQWQISTSNQSGFTIIESLVAIVVTSILLAAIAPVIVLSVGTRVQARRIELASDAAKTYVEGVRSRTINAPVITSDDELKEYPAPTVGSLTCNANSYCTAPTTNLYCVSLDGTNCTTTNTRNFVIQAFGYHQMESTTADQGYQLGVRVYRSDGFASDGGALKTAPNKQMTFTGGLGERKAPLVELTTEIATKTTKFSDFCDRLKPPEDEDNENSTCES